ncbi:uncharacterized protein [Gossypium hirsutum]|uniref:Retrotransposon gag domain-containing protein n=1 Tax=Gossypium hirsutum TaxID=3635 RepID=A0A1U8IG30_GOSHI|nr:uncharacterized protein LOC107894561 [Gossypium hirsutum]
MGASYVDACRREFLNLTQGDRTVAEYEAEFLRLNRYARGMVATKYERCVQFGDGLRDGLMVMITPQREWDFGTLVDKAKIAEEVKRAERQNREKGKGKREVEVSNLFQRPKKKVKADGSNRVGALAATRPQFCIDYGRCHQGECWKRIGACFRGLFSSHREAVGRLEVEIVWAVVVEHWAKVMVTLRRGSRHWYIGSTHFDVACTVTKNLGIPIENNSSGITVLSPLGQSIRVNKLFRNVPLEDEEVVIIGERQNYLIKVISALRAEKLVRKDCEAYLAYISVSESEGYSIKDIRIVKDFPDVFPDELSGLPPDREVEFRIELLPGTAPVSISPYRMALKELVEVKAQIQELLDRGIIRLSVSP